MVEIRRISSANPQEFRELCDLLIDSVEGGASVGFLSPLSMETASDYWRAELAATAHGLVVFTAVEDEQIVGSVQLAPCTKENGRHRAEVRKLFVLRSHRGRKIASALMEAAESAGREEGYTLLVLDTHEGAPAEAMFERRGWSKAGVIPNYAASPNGKLHGTSVFYKQFAA
ncbi:MAG: GNAT family N-acetyltransferase [Desulfovibrio sp.]|uniref:GNAT family N-acetyltransferase n=1 Tax=Desulfovibrio sp. 7SRBS1 TaxID=3378064 RepID=UPI003B41F2E7